MMRNKPAASMQKTYDECYLICSTAVFFESQNNEAEALRSWKNALDQINYHNAYRVSSSYIPRSETEKALYDSLKQMEMQCKERVDLLEALKESRQDTERDESSMSGFRGKGTLRPTSSNTGPAGGWLGGETVPPMQYSNIPSPAPALPARPPVQSRLSNNNIKEQNTNTLKQQSSPLSQLPNLPQPIQHTSRSPSPDHGRKTMRKTLRPEGRPRPARPKSSQASKPAPMKAAGLAWEVQPRAMSVVATKPEVDPTIEARLSATAARRSLDQARIEEARSEYPLNMPDPADFIPDGHWRDTSFSSQASPLDEKMESMSIDSTRVQTISIQPDQVELEVPPPPTPPHLTPFNPVAAKAGKNPPPRLTKPPELSYRKEYLPATSKVAPSLANSILEKAYNQKSSEDSPSSAINRKPVPAVPPPRTRPSKARKNTGSESDDNAQRSKARPRKPKAERKETTGDITPPSTDADSPDDSEPKSEFDKRAEYVMKHLPKGLDEAAAKNILNEIVVKGDEVHWDDVAGLSAAKKALKEAVVYPFLRPDLFMGLREPARGMLLFGPPGTGKTMLARAVATESKSTFFAISASSLTSKWHGESEKLVRALFGLAKALAPSIIFVDEIDSLLSSRGGGSEHEASRRSKTEFLIQWSDLQKAAAGRDSGIGDASRVLVLAATNCPWDIDDAARRRFVRRQYIPLPEAETRETQFRTLLGAQKHDLSERDINRLVRLTDGYSGSDITALAKDAAMGPLRNLGEALLHTPMDQIRPIQISDFEASLINIRPSVGKKGLEEYEAWANEYGERGG